MHNILHNFTQYLQVEKGYSLNTVASYRSDLMQFVQSMKISSVIQLDVNVINKYLLMLKKREYQKTSMNRKLAALSTFFKYLLREKIIYENIAVHIEFPKYKKRLPKLVSKSSIKSLLKESDVVAPLKLNDIRNRTMLALMYYCGLRVTEVVSLQIKDVNMFEKYIRVMGKGRKERFVPFNSDMAEIFKLYLKLWGEAVRSNFFAKSNGGALTRQRVWEILKESRQEKNIVEKMSPHTLRHTFATCLLENNVDLRYIQEMLGHCNIATTEIYTAVSTKRLHNVFKKAHPRA